MSDSGETAIEQVHKALKVEQPDIVLLGAGVRTEPHHFLLFEKLINAIHSQAPNAKIAFNSLPCDTLESLQRWG